MGRVLQLSPKEQVLACFIALAQFRLQIVRLRPNILCLGAWAASDASGAAHGAESHIARLSAMKGTHLHDGASTVAGCQLDSLEIVRFPYDMIVTADGRPSRNIPKPAYLLGCNSGNAFKNNQERSIALVPHPNESFKPFWHAAVDRPPLPCSSRKCSARPLRGTVA